MECRHTGKEQGSPVIEESVKRVLYIRMCHVINVNKPFRLALMGQWSDLTT